MGREKGGEMKREGWGRGREIEEVCVCVSEERRESKCVCM